MSDRKARFDALVEDYDSKALQKCVDFEKHRFISIERDAQTINRYVKSHRSLKEACAYLSCATEEGEPYVPEEVIDLDSGQRHELDLVASVFPKAVDAVIATMPRRAAAVTLATLEQNHDPGLLLDLDAARDALRQALTRR